jgi:hypothetical protein
MEPDPMIVDRIAVDHGLSRETAQSHFNGALQFLELVASGEEGLVPSAAIDRAWHAFILHTEQYLRYCQENFGRYIHHRPSLEPSGSAEIYNRTRKLASARFGELDDEVWVQPAMWCRSSSNCGPGGCWGGPDSSRS